MQNDMEVMGWTKLHPKQEQKTKQKKGMWAVNRQFDIIWILFMSSPFHKIHIKWALGSETGWVKATGESLRCDAASFSGECDTDLLCVLIYLPRNTLTFC